MEAKNDLKDIAEYISKDSKQYAKLQVSRIVERTKFLHYQVLLGKVVEEINKPNIPEVIQVNYRIIYKMLNETQVDILTIHHCARDLTKRKI